jgi:vacuolar protein-sorting-associated protein 4
MASCFPSEARKLKKTVEKQYQDALSFYDYAGFLEMKQRSREAYLWYLRSQAVLKALQLECFSVCNATFGDNVKQLLARLEQRLPLCMARCIDEVIRVRYALKKVRKSGAAHSYKLQLSDVITNFEKEVFLTKLTREEKQALLPESGPEEYTDEEGDQRPPTSQDVLLEGPLREIPLKVRRRPFMPRCQTKTFQDLMAAEQPWDSLKVLVQTQAPQMSWLDIVGYTRAKKQLHSLLVRAILRNKEERLLNANIDPKKQESLSVLLFGPVGTGKSQLCDSVAREASCCTYIKCKPSDLLAKYRGESAKNIDLLFQMASDLGPSIIFIDECEDLLASRDSETGQARSDMSSSLLQNITTYKNVSLLCATNLPWRLDDGYIRRFTELLLVDLPGELTRAVMLKKKFGEMFTVVSDDEYLQLAKKTEGLSGADISRCFQSWRSKLDAEAADATHFRICPYRGNKVIPCSPDDPDDSVRKTSREDIVLQAVSLRPTTFKDLTDVFESKVWKTVQETALKLHRDYAARLGI